MKANVRSIQLRLGASFAILVQYFIGLRSISQIVVLVDGFLHEGATCRTLLHERRRHSPESTLLTMSTPEEKFSEFACFDHEGKKTGLKRQRSSQIRIRQDNSIVVRHPTKELHEELRSYVSNLQRARQADIGSTRVAKSLVHFLSENPLQGLHGEVSNEGTYNMLHQPTTKPMIELMERALIQALRLAGESNDYKLIMQLITSAIAFANNHPILTPRIFGEAITALSQTPANAAKIKSIWSIMTSETTSQIPSFLLNPPTAFELNVLLKAMASRGKFKACIDLYQQHSSSRSRRQQKKPKNKASIYIRPDAYTVSTILSILTDSISSEQKPCDPVVMVNFLDNNSGSCDLQTKLVSLSNSTCWQWNAALGILDSLETDDEDDIRSTTTSSLHHWNNQAYCSLLKLQGKAQDMFGIGRGHRSGPQLTMAILDDMLQNHVMPDEVTCALAIKAMGRAEESTSLSRKQRDYLGTRSLAVNFLQQMKSDPRLPNPNQYCYCAAITACARSKDHVTAMELLEEMRSGASSNGDDPKNEGDDQLLSSSLPPPPNTWVYNAVLHSLDDRPQPFGFSLDVGKFGRRKNYKPCSRNDQKVRGEAAGALLEQMKQDHFRYNWCTIPDTVTYNTILRIKSFSALQRNRENTTHILNLLDEMEADGVGRDAITYQNAIFSSSSTENVLGLLQKCLSDSSFRGTQRHTKLHGLTNVFNSGLSFLASREDHGTFMKAFALMQERSIALNNESISPLIYVLGKSGKCATLESLIDYLGGSMEGKTTKEQSSRIDFLLDDNHSLPALRESHYTEAIQVCLLADEFKYAYNILSMMRAKGILPSQECMESFAVAYAQAALNVASKEVKVQGSKVRDETRTSWTRADSAYRIALALVHPRPSVLGKVARACALTGQWVSARALLRSIHNGIRQSNPESSTWSERHVIENVKGTQSYLLRECANQGNAEAALWYTRDIQEFATSLRPKNDHNNYKIVAVSNFAECSLENDIFANLRAQTLLFSSRVSVGMCPQDWISLAKAASKSGQWRVCINTLQFIRPYVERTNPRGSGLDSKLDDERYEQLTPALTTVVRCLESQSQYAWAMRVIKDWIGWSGRKPRAEAVLSAMRALSSSGRGEELQCLLGDCLRKDLKRCYNRKDIGYEEMLYIGAVTSLHRHGLFDDADEVFMSGVTDGFLPFNYFRENGKCILDLHGLNIALAHSAVRIALRHQPVFEKDSIMTDMMIITGRGRNSASHLRPILRPEVQRMLLEEFYPPLNTFTIAGNSGALTVLADDVTAWHNHQKAMKGARMLDLAAVLRNLANPDRLKQSLALTMKAKERNILDCRQ